MTRTPLVRTALMPIDTDRYGGVIWEWLTKAPPGLVV